MPSLQLSHCPSQLFDLRAPSSTDVPFLLLNQPNECMDCPPKNDPCGEVAVSRGSTVSQQSRMFFQSVTQVAPKKNNLSSPSGSGTYDRLVTSPGALPLRHRRLVGAKATKLQSWGKNVKKNAPCVSNFRILPSKARFTQDTSPSPPPRPKKTMLTCGRNVFAPD